jgi:hypothetical protein
MYKQRHYKKVMKAEDAKTLLLGRSGLIMGQMEIPEINPPYSGERHIKKVVVSIEGTDGHVYTGIAERYAYKEGMRWHLHEQEVDEGLNMVNLFFKFGERQATKPLDERVLEYGFAVPKDRSQE